MDFTGLRRLAALTGGGDEAVVRARWSASRWFGAFERGACDAQAFGAGVVRDLGLHLPPDEFLHDFGQWPAGPFPGAIDLVRALHGVVPMGCLSNTNAVHWQQHLDRWGVVDHFEWRFVSTSSG